MLNIEEVFSEAIQTVLKEQGMVNILIAGRSGVGKSTLINAVFQKNIAETGQGRPITRDTREITKEGVPITILDTRGLEISQYEETLKELEHVISERNRDRDSNRHIHAAWLCIQEDGRRVEQAEIDLYTMLSAYVPVVSVITKARNDCGFKVEVQKLLPECKNVTRVRAIQETLDDGHILPPVGLKELVELTSEIIPDGKRRAFAASQKANIDYTKEQAHQIVAASALAAAAAGATPIPFSDAIVLVPIQVGMIVGVSAVFGLDISKASISSLLSSIVGASSATVIGRTLVVNALKLIPGAGSVVGGAISATTASALTLALGKAYIEVLAKIFSENPDAIPNEQNIGQLLKEEMQKA